MEAALAVKIGLGVATMGAATATGTVGLGGTAGIPAGTSAGTSAGTALMVADAGVAASVGVAAGEALGRAATSNPVSPPSLAILPNLDRI